MTSKCHACTIGAPSNFCTCDDVDDSDIEMCLTHNMSLSECPCLSGFEEEEVLILGHGTIRIPNLLDSEL